MHPLHLRLAEGSHRDAVRIADEAAGDPELTAVLVDGLASANSALRNRAASALDLATRRHPGLLAPHADALLRAARADARGSALRRTLPLLLARLLLDHRQAEAVLALARRRLRDTPANGTRANALTALASVAEQRSSQRAGLVAELDAWLDAPEPSLRARARLLLARLDRQ